MNEKIINITKLVTFLYPKKTSKSMNVACRAIEMTLVHIATNQN